MLIWFLTVDNYHDINLKCSSFECLVNPNHADNIFGATSKKKELYVPTATILSHCVPLPAPGPPRTNTTTGFTVEVMSRFVTEATIYGTWSIGKYVNPQSRQSRHNLNLVPRALGTRLGWTQSFFLKVLLLAGWYRGRQSRTARGFFILKEEELFPVTKSVVV